ncbi:MAG: RNA polymerase sigma factor [Myxococcota bacterium]|nr:RNA polymerase sigma factor [Myxococcota bacterium]
MSDDAETDERPLIAALRRRDTGAFDELYRRHHQRIWLFLARLTGDRIEAEDLFQETWLAAARHAHRLAEDSELLPWLFTIARNKHRGARRFLVFDLRRKERFALEPLAQSPLAPDEHAHARARAADVSDAFDALGDAHREVLLLSIVEGLDARQLAAVLGIREDAVRKRISRARAELAALLDADATRSYRLEGEPS